jgi:hypothetical protein
MRGDFTSIDVHNQFDWTRTCELETPNYVSYICASQDNRFVVCADNSIHVLAVDLAKLKISYLQSIECYEQKVVNQCCFID